MRFQNGRSYLAGFDEPFVVSRARLAEELQKLGFSLLAVDDCERWGDVPFDTPTPCGDSWDAIGYVVRTGPDAEMELPTRIKWIRGFEMEQPEPPVALPLILAGDSCADAETWCFKLGQRLGGCDGQSFHCAPYVPWEKPPEPKTSALTWGLAGAAIGVVGLLAYYGTR